MRVRFLSGNRFKIEEATTILAQADVQVVPVELALTELQTANTELLVRDKTLKAFHRLGHKVFVEQTGQFLDRMNGLPGGLTQVFWDALGPDRVCELFGQGGQVGVVAKTRIGYCDGRGVHQFEGGDTRPHRVRASWGSQLPVGLRVRPDGYDLTFAEMGERKNDISMRRRALDVFSAYLREAPRA